MCFFVVCSIYIKFNLQEGYIMRAVVQRVDKAMVTVGNTVTGQIQNGLVVLLGVTEEDNNDDITYLAEKIINLRIFDDAAGKLNLSLSDVGGELLVVSQFTLYGDCRKGRRPSYDKAAKPELAEKLYLSFVEYCKNSGFNVSTGRFQSEMLVEIHNNGPVTILLDSKKIF